MPLFSKPTKLENVWAASGDKTPPPDDAKINQGFIIEIPIIEQFNYIDNKQDQMLAHLNQRGVPEWDSISSYYANISYVQGSNGIIYRAKQDSGGTLTAVNPVTEVGSVKWGVAFYFSTDVYTKTESNAAYMVKSSNLSDLTNTATARTNISVYSKAESNSFYANRANNLSDVSSASTAFNNIKQQATESYVGAGRIATDSEASNATDNTVLLTPRKLKLGVSISLGDTGWVDLPTWLGGIQIRWGRYVSAKNSPQAVGFGKPFSNSCSVIAPSFAEDNARGDISLSYEFSGTTGFISHYHRDGSGGGSVNCSYIAIGY